MSDPRDHLQADLADRYLLERELGRGGMATVYLARDLRHKRLVALKVLHPELAYALGGDRFLREIEVAANLTHPHILPLHDSGEAAGLLYYVMPYVEGESLRDRLNRETQLPVDAALQIAREVADALAYAHGHGIVHRDIKPENILLSGGHALVADFGIAHAVGQAGGDRLTETGMAVGTAVYMSPEQASGERQVDGRSDVYSLACVLYEMLAGEPPYTGPSAQAIVAKRFSDPVPKVRRVRPAVPEGLEHAITKALALVPADRFATAADFAQALAHPATAVAPLPSPIERRKPRKTSRVVWLMLAVGLAGAVVIGGIVFRGRPSPALNADLLAIAPFDVPNPELKLWQDGLIDLLSRNFDGAGSLRTVPPTVVVRRFKGRADRASATELGRRTGARLVLFGALLGAGDSARLSATLLDVERSRVLGEVEVRDSPLRMDRLADSLTVRLLRELGRTRRVGAVLSMSFGSTSLPALRAFLQGEQFYRLGEWDSAMVHYEQATSLDSTLAPAYRRMSNVIGWQRSGGDSLSVLYGLRAGSLNHGLAPRESLLVTADSLYTAAFSANSDSLYYALVERLFTTTSEATRRYPNDPEAWYTLGEVRHHMGEPFGVTGHQVLEAFDRSIALDSAFALAYIHNVDLALELGGPELARRYVRAYLALNPSDIHAVGNRAVEKILDPDSNREAELQQLLDTLPALPLGQVMITFWRFPDPEETAAKIFRRFAADPRGSRYSDPDYQRWTVGILAYRGHLREAYTKVGTRGPPSLYAASALLGVIPRDTARTIFARWLDESDPQASHALPWWAAMGDTVSLRRFLRWHDSPARPAPHRILERRNRYWAAAAGGYLALARRDSAEALRRFTQLPESLCSGGSCLSSRLTKAELLSAHGQDREAAIVLLPHPGWTDSPPQALEVFWLLQRGRVAERLNDREQALRSFHTVADVWLHADPELQSYVAEARAAIQRLSGEVR